MAGTGIMPDHASDPNAAPPGHLLSVEHLRTAFAAPDGEVVAVEDFSFTVEPGETVAIVGESGSGKSVTAMSILRLFQPSLAHVSGRVVFQGRELLDLSERDMRGVRGKRIGMIFQEPMSALNPVMTIGAQIAETLRLHQDMTRRQARARAFELLLLVGISAAERRLDDYPHQLSGGMRQRVMIAIALACDPALLIADEPTTALDVTTQAQILDLIRDLRARIQSAMILITHDLGIVAEIADRVVIMYAGRKVEEGPVAQILANPIHPYTRGLIGAMPVPGSAGRGGVRPRLVEIAGNVPSPRERPAGCAFAPRCAHVGEDCHAVVPEFIDCGEGRGAACHRLAAPLSIPPDPCGSPDCSNARSAP